MRLARYLVLSFLVTAACQQDEGPEPYDLDFDIPRSESFAESLSAYELFKPPMASLEPADGILLYELSSELFTDYAFKQRLLAVPQGTSIAVGSDDRLEYPEGTIMAKTFYYPDDMRAPDGAKRVIETRLLVKTAGVWNVATYLWNAEQTEATLLVDGTTTAMSWLDAEGQARSTDYAVPHEGECVTCHQTEGASTFIGPTLRNLNRPVTRGGSEVNQLDHLQSVGVLDANDWTSAPTIPDYKDTSRPLAVRARAYLHINCAHCHSPGGWDEATQRDFDFRFATALDQTGLASEPKRLRDALEAGEMPYIGTTLLHAEGVRLVLDYMDSL